MLTKQQKKIITKHQDFLMEIYARQKDDSMFICPFCKGHGCIKGDKLQDLDNQLKKQAVNKVKEKNK